MPGRKRSKEGQDCLDAVSMVYMPRMRLSYSNKRPLTAACNCSTPQLLAGEFARSLAPYADCVEKYGGSRMTRDTVRDVYIKYLEHNPSAAPRFHAWVDPTAPSPSPPLSEPAPSSSTS